MAPRSWATGLQLEYLKSLKPKFLEAQEKKTSRSFRLEVENEWMRRWPVEATDHELGDLTGLSTLEIDERRKEFVHNKVAALRKRLGEWWYNHGREKSRQSLSTRKSVIALVKPKHRALSAIELYSRKYYAERIKPFVLAEIQAQKVPKAKTLDVIKAKTRERWLLESEDFRADIVAELEAIKQEPDPDAKNPAEYAEAIAALPTFFDKMFEELEQSTGWKFSVIAGGPSPEVHGEIMTRSFHSGKNLLGQSFTDMMGEEAMKGWVKPYQQFIRASFSEADCQSRALTNVPTGETKEGSIGDNEMTAETANELVKLTFDERLIDPQLRENACESESNTTSREHAGEHESDVTSRNPTTILQPHPPVPTPVEPVAPSVFSDVPYQAAGSLCPHDTTSPAFSASTSNRQPTEPAQTLPSAMPVSFVFPPMNYGAPPMLHLPNALPNPTPNPTSSDDTTINPLCPTTPEPTPTFASPFSPFIAPRMRGSPEQSKKSRKKQPAKAAGKKKAAGGKKKVAADAKAMPRTPGNSTSAPSPGIPRTLGDMDTNVLAQGKRIRKPAQSKELIYKEAKRRGEQGGEGQQDKGQTTKKQRTK